MIGTSVPLTAVSPQYVALLGIVVYVAAALGAVPIAAVILTGSALTDSSTRTVTTYVAGGVGVLGVAGFVYTMLGASLGTAASVALILGVAAVALWVLPVAVGTGILSALTDANDPLKYAVFGWPVATVAPVAYLRLFTPPPSSPLLLVGLFGVPLFGPAVVGYVARQVDTRIAS